MKNIPCTSKVLASFLIFVLAGCSSFNQLTEGERVDYKSAQKLNTSLEVPPDLSSLPQNDRFAIPTENTNVLSAYTAQTTNITNTTRTLLPTVPDAHIERAGSQRWLVVNKSPEEVWPIVKEFWQDMGFIIQSENQETGIMETDWAEDRAKIPQDLIRQTLGKLLDNLYATGERDKFRTRLERTKEGNTEIFISHRGMVEVYTNSQQDTTAWQPRANDPELEADFLRRLLLRFGIEDAKAKAIVGQPIPESQTKLQTDANGVSYISLEETFDRAWRRVGLALDRVDFTVEDRDRIQGTYFVRYVDPQDDSAASQRGFFERLFSASDDDKQAVQYRIVVKEQGNAFSTVLVQSKDGVTLSNDSSERILTLLYGQLK